MEKKQIWWVDNENFVQLKRILGSASRWTDKNFHTTSLRMIIKFFRKMDKSKDNQILLDNFIERLNKMQKIHDKVGYLTYDNYQERCQVMNFFMEYLKCNFHDNIVKMVNKAL